MVGPMVNLDAAQAMSLLRQADHAVLGTLHPTRGVDLVPVVFAVDGHDHLGVPIDRVKPKSGTRLRREDNLGADPRGTLLVERWDRDDWSRLFWVRAHLRWQGVDHGCEEALADLLADRYPQYRDRPFDRVLVFQIERLTGWSAVGLGDQMRSFPGLV